MGRRKSQKPKNLRKKESAPLVGDDWDQAAWEQKCNEEYVQDIFDRSYHGRQGLTEQRKRQLGISGLHIGK